MPNIKRRLDSIEATLFGVDAEQYRLLCHAYNLHRISEEDLIESILAPLEGRELNPEIEKQLSAPIPPDAPRHLIEKAKRSLLSRPEPMDDEKIEEIRREVVEFRDELRRARESWRKPEEAP
jgi:hypothetical protein